MTPFYFGSPERRLFGVYDPAREGSGKTRAAVLCHPAGDEYVHAYRTMRQLASRLSAAGVHVLRFDYYATGDSAGDTADGGLAGWCDDIKTAIAELKDMTQVSEVSLVGLRHGANMACRVAADSPDDVAAVVLWEPLDTSREFLLAPHAGEDFQKFDLSLLADHLPPRTLVVLTAPESRSDTFGNLAVARFSGVVPWVEERVETGTIPSEALQDIVTWLT
jgi:alpha/beta superfamily hydrolase